MPERIGFLVLFIAFQVWLAQASPLAAQARGGPSNRPACTSPQAYDLLNALEGKNDLGSVLELLRARHVEYSVINQTRPFFPNSDLERLGQEGTSYQLVISTERRTTFIFISAEVVSLIFEGSKLTMRSCKKILTGP
jgi:hypothetical protein